MPDVPEPIRTRPAETLSLSIAAVIAAVLFVYGVIKDGLDINDVSDPEFQAAVTVIVGAIATLVTWYIARRQRDPKDNLAAAPDGAVIQT